jgi:hypothetical protein
VLGLVAAMLGCSLVWAPTAAGGRPSGPVTNRIRDALARIEAGQSALGRHLRTSIRTGTFCSYQPERTVAWEVRAGR